MILNVYKEKNWTSFDVVAKVRSMLGKKTKVGHAGTLDPLAEGVLIVLTDNDTKKQNNFMSMDKEYLAEISFGASSTTFDLEGEITYLNIPEDMDILSEFKGIMKKYLGEIDQTVPYYSAVKVKGKKLYELARKNKPVDKLPKKKVKINSIEILDFYTKDNLPTVKLLINCSKGTYIRSLANDIGEDLGVGGILVNLVRTKVGIYTAEESVKISELKF